MQKVCIVFFILIFSLSSRGNRPQVPDWSEETLRAMTLDEKIGQLFMIAIYSNKDKEYQEKIEGIIRKYHIGGLIFFQGEPVRQLKWSMPFRKSANIPC